MAHLKAVPDAPNGKFFRKMTNYNVYSSYIAWHSYQKNK